MCAAHECADIAHAASWNVLHEELGRAHDAVRDTSDVRYSSLGVLLGNKKKHTRTHIVYKCE